MPQQGGLLLCQVLVLVLLCSSCLSLNLERLRNPNFSLPLTSSDWTCNGCTAQISTSDSYDAGGKALLVTNRCWYTFCIELNLSHWEFLILKSVRIEIFSSDILILANFFWGVKTLKFPSQILSSPGYVLLSFYIRGGNIIKCTTPLLLSFHSRGRKSRANTHPLKKGVNWKLGMCVKLG